MTAVDTTPRSACLQNALATAVLTSPDTAAELAALVVKEVRTAGLGSGVLAELAAQIAQYAPEAQAGGAAVQPAPGPEAVPAHEQFKLTEKDTALGKEYSFTLEPGQCIREVFDAANESYARLASPQQKELISGAVYHGALYNDAGVDVPVTERTTFTVRPMIKGSTAKRLDQQMDSETGRLIFIDSEEVHGKPRPEIAAVAALKLVKSVSEGILVTPGQPQGDALEGKWSRALGGGLVELRGYGLCADDWCVGFAAVFIGCAGSGSSRGNS